MNLLRWCLFVLLPLLVLVAGCVTPLAAPQATPRAYRIGYFGNGGDPRPSPNVAAFKEGLAQFGYAVDQNLTIEFRWTEGKSERLPAIAHELAALKLDAVFTSSEMPAQAMLEVEADVPIVMVT
jgi:putative tryptophan/tyrosine transport system substrate-binding protein